MWGVGVFLFCLFLCLVDFTFISFCFHPSLVFLFCSCCCCCWVGMCVRACVHVFTYVRERVSVLVCA